MAHHHHHGTHWLGFAENLGIVWNMLKHGLDSPKAQKNGSWLHSAVETRKTWGPNHRKLASTLDVFVGARFVGALAVDVQSWSHNCSMGTSVKAGVHHLFVHIYIYIYTYIYIYMYVCMYVGRYVWMYIYIYRILVPCWTSHKKTYSLAFCSVFSRCAFAPCFRVPFCNQCDELRCAATLSAKGPSAYEIAWQQISS